MKAEEYNIRRKFRQLYLIIVIILFITALISLYISATIDRPTYTNEEGIQVQSLVMQDIITIGLFCLIVGIIITFGDVTKIDGQSKITEKRWQTGYRK